MSYDNVKYFKYLTNAMTVYIKSIKSNGFSYYLLISHEFERRLGCDFDDVDAVAPP